MSLFSNEPPEEARGHSLAICRTPAQKPLIAICTSDQILGCPTHYWHGRTVPHFEEDCTPCSEGSPWRWHGWVGAYNPKLQQHALFEMTAQATDPFKDYRLANATIRGAKFTATRPSHRVNGRLMIVLAACNLAGVTLPAAPHVMAVLSILWNIPLSRLEQSGTTKELPRLRANADPDSSTDASNGQGLNHHEA